MRLFFERSGLSLLLPANGYLPTTGGCRLATEL